LHRAVLSVATIALVAAAFLLRAPLLDQIELKTYDLRFLSRGRLQPAAPIAIAAIDEKSLDELGRWPWSRRRFADLIDVLSRGGARVVVFDIGFPEASPDPADDVALAEAIRRSDAAVVLGYFFHMSRAALDYDLPDQEIRSRLELIASSAYPLVLMRPDATDSAIASAYAPESNIAILARAAPSSGYFSLRQDQDGIVRGMPLVIRSGDDLYPPLAVLAAWQALQKPQLAIRVGRRGVEGIQLGDRFSATDPSGRVLIDYLGPPKTFPHVSIADVLSGRIPADAFRGAIVVIGATATGLFDARSTPFSTVYPGPEIHATVADQLLSGRQIRRPSWAQASDLLAIVVLGALPMVAVSWLGATTAILVTCVVLGLYVFAAVEAFVRAGVWIGITYPVLSLFTGYVAQNTYDYVRERREKKRINDAFGRYVSPVVVEQMLKDPARLQLGGEQKVLTVLFSDLQGFTSYSERYTPHQMIELLSEYYARMTECVFAHEGMLKEYVGDELMAIFGAPIEQPDHASRACAAALEMRARRAALTEEWAKTGRPPLHARTGVNSGPMLVGNLGSEYRYSYGCLGDNVNLGSRLEGLNKQYGTEILIGEQTADLIGADFTLREVDLVRVVGKKKPTRIYELLCDAREPIANERNVALSSYARALDAYRSRRWTEARDLLEKALKAWPHDGPSRILLERCALFALDPPSGDWDGVFEATKK